MKKGEVYRHYKGGIYTYLGIVMPKTENHDKGSLIVHELTATEESTGKTLNVTRALYTRAYIADVKEPCVLYKSTKDGQLWARPIEDFCGWVMEGDHPSIKRFKLVEDK